jgi:hypothetical protein
MNPFDLLSPDGHPIFVTRLTNTPGQDYPHHEYVRSAEDYDAFIKRNDKPGLALYHAVARLKEGAARSKENVESSHYVWTDIDYKDHPDIEASEIKRRILEGPNPPSFMVLSGGGVHPYHRLKEPVDARPGPAQAELERALKLSCSYHGGDPQAAEAARLLRMPGSTNSKRGTPIPVEATAISDRTYELSDLIEFWSEAQPLLPSPKMEKKVNGSEWSSDDRVDARARLSAMAFEGEGENSIHNTQLSVTSSELNNGVDAAQVIEDVLRATQEYAKRDEHCRDWDWEEEKKTIGGMVASWINKNPKLIGTLPDKYYRKWIQDEEEGLAPKVYYLVEHGLHVRGKKRSAGAEKPQEEKPEGENKGVRFKLVSFSDMRPGPEPLYLIDELIPIKGLVDIWGKPKCFKSFNALDMMLHVALGWEYHERYVRQGTVVYCAFEGAHGYKKRIEALRRHYKIADDLNVPLHIMPGQANLIKDHKLLISDLKAQLGDTAPAAVVLDTLNKSLIGSESKDVDMSAYLRAAEAVRDAFNCVVIIVHHCGLDETRPRGHTSLPGAVDAQISVTREGDLVTVTVEMMRDGPEGTAITCTAKSIEVGTDANGKVLTSLVMVPAEAAGATAPRRWSKALSNFRRALSEALIHSHETVTPNGETFRAADRELVKEEFYKIHPADGDTPTQQQDSRKHAFNRAVKRAQDESLIGIRVDHAKRTLIWLTDAPPDTT